jgi:hypothetical protein
VLLTAERSQGVCRHGYGAMSVLRGTCR